MPIEPTIGRIVHYYGGANDPVGQPYPCAAIVTGVVHDREVHVRVFGRGSGAWTVQSVMLLQDQDQPKPMTRYCKWMEHQKGQAAKAEALETALVHADAEKALTQWLQDHLAPQLKSYGLTPASPNANFSETGTVMTFAVVGGGYDFDIVTSAGQVPDDSAQASDLAKASCAYAVGEICRMAGQDGKSLTPDALKTQTMPVPAAPRQEFPDGA